MKYDTILERLNSYIVPGDWPPSIFLLPENAMRDIYDCIVGNRLRHCIELGTGHGATSCVMAAALEEVGDGRIVTIDKTLHLPVNANVLKDHTGIGDNLEFVVEPLGYNWYMADLIAKQTLNGVCEPIFDFCLLDGAHEFEPDALAFFLVSKILKPGGWVVLDDINFSLRSMSFWRETHGHLSDRELDSCQIGIVYDYAVKQHPDFADFRITENGRVGWARKTFLESQVTEKHNGDDASVTLTNRESAIQTFSELTDRKQQEGAATKSGRTVSGKPSARGLKKLRIHVLYEHSESLHPHGCSHIRLLLPLTHPLNADTFSLTRGTTYAGADVLIVERMWRPKDISLALAEDLVRRVRRNGVCLIYSIDDDLLDLKLDEAGRKNFTTEQLMAVRYFIREADGIIVTTDRLKDRLALLNRRVFVVPNALDERLWRNRSLSEGSANVARRKVIGYMGTYTHDADLMMILQALREAIRKHPDIELQLIGGVADPAVIQAFNGLPLRILDTGGNFEYPAFARWMAHNVFWDVALAPLEDNAFTRCKSDIKFLDYSALGIAGIYSAVPAYEQTVRHLETGYLVNNDTQNWVEAIERLTIDDSLRQRLGRNAREYVFSTRTLEHRAGDWRNVILSIAGQQNTPPLTDSVDDLVTEIARNV